MSVVHNRLARRAFEAGGAVPQAFLDLFRGPTALLFGADGAVSASKGISRWHRKNQGAAPIKGGLLKGKVLAPGEVKQLAELPDAPTLRSQVAARMLSPAQVLATAASSLVARFAGSVRARRESLEAGEGGGTEESPG
jgi:large subunit ribosomal protein L10